MQYAFITTGIHTFQDGNVSVTLAYGPSIRSVEEDLDHKRAAFANMRISPSDRDRGFTKGCTGFVEARLVEGEPRDDGKTWDRFVDVQAVTVTRLGAQVAPSFRMAAGIAEDLIDEDEKLVDRLENPEPEDDLPF